MGKAAQSLKDIKSSKLPVSVWWQQNSARGVKKILAMKGNQSDYRCLDPNSGFWRCQVFLWLQKSASPNQILIGGTDLTCANPFSSEFWVMYGMKSSRWCFSTQQSLESRCVSWGPCTCTGVLVTESASFLRAAWSDCLLRRHRKRMTRTAHAGPFANMGVWRHL